MITRPNVAFHIGLLSRLLTSPMQQHLDCIIHLLRYLTAHASRGLLFSSDDTTLAGYADASWADGPDTSRSTGFFISTIGSAPVLWKSGRQPIAALSSTEAEHAQLKAAVKELCTLASCCWILDSTSPRYNHP